MVFSDELHVLENESSFALDFLGRISILASTVNLLSEFNLLN